MCHIRPCLGGYGEQHDSQRGQRDSPHGHEGDAIRD